MDKLKRRVHLTVEDAKGAARDALRRRFRSHQTRAAHQFQANVKLLQRVASDSASDLTRRVQKTAVEATGAAHDRVRSSVSESTAKLKRMSSSVVEVVDARARARRVRNKLVLFGCVGIFLYGFGSALPHAAAKYALERAKIEGESTETDVAAANT
ncbi:unnamed protein product [Hyaloperonospora brassicae]|uniref:Transmembrane protein n=1 Tax=Hyaloperonospora brassicae TaxID=162125 RepID=A0AAV0U953_HYABA|nr:unnamed protein product [Hyaloperonospora brassicae]